MRLLRDLRRPSRPTRPITVAVHCDCGRPRQYRGRSRNDCNSVGSLGRRFRWGWRRIHIRHGLPHSPTLPTKWDFSAECRDVPCPRLAVPCCVFCGPCFTGAALQARAWQLKTSLRLLFSCTIPTSCARMVRASPVTYLARMGYSASRSPSHVAGAGGYYVAEVRTHVPCTSGLRTLPGPWCRIRTTTYDGSLLMVQSAPGLEDGPRSVMPAMGF